MNVIQKITKLNTSEIDEYMNAIYSNCIKRHSIIKTPLKVIESDFTVPSIENYGSILKYNYNISQLKEIAKKYNIKKTGNKNELTQRIYSFLYFSLFIIKIQKRVRGTIARKYKLLRGPASINRKICTNTDDFITMESLEEIKFHNFISYKDVDNFIYGFDIASLYTLFVKSKNREVILNPYNRNTMPETLFKNIREIIGLGKLLKVHINLEHEDDLSTIPNEKVIELRTLTLFQNIDALGNYSNSAWFLSLNKNQLIKFIRELNDIWVHRAQLTDEIKNKICPPNGDPFRNLSISYIYTEPNMSNVRKVILEVLEKFVNSGVDTDSRTLGAYYVLGALTLVNEDAATSLPWLFQSLNYF